MNRLYSATVVVPNRGCRSCRSRRRGCGRSLPSCPNCRRQTSSSFSHPQDGLPWHRGNDGRLVARGHQRGILSIRSRKLDVVKRHSETRRKRNGFVLSLPRGLSLARLARGDLSPWTKKNLINITPLDSDMTDLYELLVNMSLCEDEVEFIQPSYQRLASPPPCMEIDMEDLEETPLPQEENQQEDTKPTETETEESSKPTPSVETTEEQPEQQKEESSSSSSEKDDKTTLDSILTPLHQETPIPEADLAAILDSLLKHKDSSDKDTDFPSVDRFLQIMEVISQLTETVMKPATTEDSDSGKITSLTPQHLAVIMNLRSLLDYATKVLCIKSIETPGKDSVIMGNTMEVVV
ncbi:hypothetical protein QBC38DRAFT_37985 [Podospora fimiseda]|uniref:Zn(2)-C6 fungal-type domain-containing protein n=1 Tax=Podospora fimiseda TaxID=252190 RepID=A0AAN7BI30_9PEZI|nr:hypothetical protein QBC38DRAFT_37985 [Podospora fimiseda]